MLLGVYDAKETVHRSKTAVPSPHVKSMPSSGVQSVVLQSWICVPLGSTVHASGHRQCPSVRRATPAGLECSIVSLSGSTSVRTGIHLSGRLLFIVIFWHRQSAGATSSAGRLSDRIGRKGVLITGWLGGTAGAIPDHLCSSLELNCLRQCAAGHQPGGFSLWSLPLS